MSRKLNDLYVRLLCQATPLSYEEALHVLCLVGDDPDLVRAVVDGRLAAHSPGETFCRRLTAMLLAVRRLGGAAPGAS